MPNEDGLIQKTIHKKQNVSSSTFRFLGRVVDLQLFLAGNTKNWACCSADSNLLHVALIERVLDLIDDVANTSGLARDTDIRTHYLQKAVLGQLPQLTESLGQMRAHGALVLARGEVAPEERARIEALSDRVRKYYGDARKALELAAGVSLPPRRGKGPRRGAGRGPGRVQPGR
ncbi:nitrate- and nitrite sensing domain-containing protein [Paracidovorax cattleyae]|uniref:Uncharacterized protein n=1 Tax=Paracidovorax cattleyae TaxID=80868 RepID=A0A1H0NN21_9BURK|nr:nitrate- and nitrite sensing domain-containing protein [Paracidovorax cattleyae]SDO93976.1 hypothetical protein SAMN04489708_10577 [Paracidovorax cattleyae]